MCNKMRTGVFFAVLITLAIWAGGTIWFQLSGGLQIGAFTVAAAMACTCIVLRKRRLGWIALGTSIGVFALWWVSITPSNDKVWAPEVSRGVTATQTGAIVTLHNVRDFDWQTITDFTPRWEDRTYDLDKITSIDLITSVWSSEAIAHTLLSFGFSDGQRVAFSAEIRKEAGESFSSLGGLFKQFELVLIAADEADIIYLRTNARREEVSLYPIVATPAEARALFEAFTHLGNQLETTPAFYHTIFGNCTTIIYQLVHQIDPTARFDWRILASGYVADFLHDIGRIALGDDYAHMRAAARLGADHPRAGFSQAIRASAP
ncbi:hypothetical protein BVG79_00589 [Ketogulonicigenium robustum]|uniref:Lnb N-terminal periplasmic domain-containing protein n=1 Tax=Ketogulonicigenium robustum TaxID=92947 RepID=A0A1W6NXM8_9RHOB|nr:hypothetical protein BVG79_00589 [Ketogulonicigenium robustum]